MLFIRWPTVLNYLKMKVTILPACKYACRIYLHLIRASSGFSTRVTTNIFHVAVCIYWVDQKVI